AREVGCAAVTSNRRASHRLRVFACTLLAWIVLGLFMCSQNLLQKLASHEPTPWWHYLATMMISVTLWALLTFVVLWLGRKFPFRRRDWVGPLALHLVFSVTVAFTHLAIESAIFPRLGMFPTIMRGFLATLIFVSMIGFHQNVLTYWSLLAIKAGLDYYRRYQERAQQALRLELQAAELETRLVSAMLSALKMQLQPHFLFNTLNAIMVLVRQQKSRQAEEMLDRLS